MGNCCVVEGAIDHWIYVKTGDRKGSLNNANLKCILYDDKGHQSPEILLDCFYKNDFERGSTDTFQAAGLREFGDIDRIELWRDNPGMAPDVFVEVLVVNDRRTEKCYYFPVQRWMTPEKRYKIHQYDTMLPQYDLNRDQRQADLEERRQLYQYGQTAPDLPVQVASLPPDEQFSDEYKYDILESKRQLLSKAGIPKYLTEGDWQGLEDLTHIYSEHVFPEPVGMDRWSNDVCFGAQRLIGCNPHMIQVASRLPENMGITAEMLRPFLEGWTLKQIIEAKRLFMVDHKILEDLPTKDDAPIPAPIALFFVTGDKQLVPIGIQLYQDIRPNNPVFLPNDPPFTWLLAKMWFNLADATIHQCLSHFAFTHLLMEGMCVATQRHLSPVHPIYKLLQPHFLFLLAINARSLDQLMAPGGWTDECMNIGREGMFELMRRGLDEWRIDVQGCFQKDLETRGVLDPKTLPNYAYRDDGLLISKAIERYVTKVIRNYYDSHDKIKEDYELQNWVTELATPKEEGGVGIQGIPHRGKFKRAEDIAMVCSSIIFTCTVQHAAVNHNMYEEYAFPPNYTLYLEGEPPEDKLPRTENDLVQSLPDRFTTVETMAITKLLSSRGAKSLGEWDFQYQYDPPALRAEKDFQEDLIKIGNTIKERNYYRDDIYKYTYLHPSIIPNNISI